MSLRYACRVVAQGGMRAVQAVKDQVARSVTAATATSSAPSASASAASASASASASSSSKQVRLFSSALDGSASGGAGARAGGAVLRGEDRRRAEESLRTVMYLSCWGPN